MNRDRMPAALPSIVILGTGGTIAGAGTSPAATVGYRSAVFGIEELASALPEAGKIAHCRTRQVCQIDSADMTPEIWFSLRGQLQTELDDPRVAGAVVTHGTDTLEETAYFLHLTLNTRKPVVLVGAMRPATALSADGPLNLLNAVRLAASAEAAGRGVLVTMNDTIFSARSVCKGDTIRPDAFHGGEDGAVGVIAEGTAWFYRQESFRHTFSSEFAAVAAAPAPRVDIVYCCAGTPPDLLDHMAARGARGIVLACVGNGVLGAELQRKVRKLVSRGVTVVRASRTGGAVVHSPEIDGRRLHTIAANTLSPQKARILLLLCLMKDYDRKQIADAFVRY